MTSTPIHIVVVERTPQHRARLERLLLRTRYTAAFLQTCDDALDLVLQTPALLILLGALGAEDDAQDDDEAARFIERVRARHPLFDLPILLLNRGRERAIPLLRLGANDFIDLARPATALLERIERLAALADRGRLDRTPHPTPPARFFCAACLHALRHNDRPCPHCGHPLNTDHNISISVWPWLGQVIEHRYRLDQVVGQGRFGTVYRAMDLLDRATCAVKILDPTQAGIEPDTLRARIEREVQALQCLRSPHVVKATNLLRLPTDVFALVMDFAPGQPLSEIAPLHPHLALDAFAQLAHALAEAQQLGLTHRDIKPENIIIDLQSHRDPFATLLDFGLAEILHPLGEPGDTTAATFAFAAPEQLRPRLPIDHRADLYALGATLVFALTGQPPFPGPDPAAFLAQHLRATPPSLKKHLPPPWPDALAQVDDLVLRLLAKRPEDRPQHARLVRDELRSARDAWPR